ncbi:MAG TPA: NUDIX domain-containing protein [Candidatus Saccharimonadaceae bacterium]|nr:NUDIX domain-containing protein [Candidatus Saccharimonadaceae bacterium]
MPHIHTLPGRMDQSVTAFIVRTDLDEPRMLLHVHRKLGSLLPPGGHVELDETPWMAIAHELREESGYSLEELRVVQPKIRLKHLSGITLHPVPLVSNTHDIPGDHFHTDLDYLLIASAAPQGKPEKGETQEMLWLSRAEIVDLPREKIFDNTREIALFIFDEVLSSPAFELVPATDFSLEKLKKSDS